MRAVQEKQKPVAEIILDNTLIPDYSKIAVVYNEKCEHCPLWTAIMDFCSPLVISIMWSNTTGYCLQMNTLTHISDLIPQGPARGHSLAVQCSAVITWLTFYKFLTMDTTSSPVRARYGGVTCEFHIWCMFCFPDCTAVLNVVSHLSHYNGTRL